LLHGKNKRRNRLFQIILVARKQEKYLKAWKKCRGKTFSQKKKTFQAIATFKETII